MCSKKILIITPLFPPSNVASVHRSRLFAQHLPKFGWEPIILTVDEKYHDFELDWNLVALLPKNLRIEKVAAIPTNKIKFIKEIGIRAFYHLYKKALEICREEEINFVYIPIPTFQIAILGRMLKWKTRIKYGIDYIDPWVYKLPKDTPFFSKYWLNMQIHKIMEPMALKEASLITGVAPGYYADAIQRNKLQNKVVTAAMPYGGEKKDNKIANEMKLPTYLFKTEPNVLNFVYAGAMLPQAFKPLEKVMEAIALHVQDFNNVKIHFIGSGKSPDDPEGYNIKELAIKYKLWETVFFEYPKRIPYLDVLSHLNIADGTFILGSTEAHYTPSKVYQSILSEKPIFAVLHKASSACQVIKKSRVGSVLEFDGIDDLNTINATFYQKWLEHKIFMNGFNPKEIDTQEFDQYSAEKSTELLAAKLDKLFA
jgi:hypothetical protein